MTSPRSEQDAYHELCGYTLTRGDPSFIHQHVVDAFAAQQATADGKPIAITFALIGLYLRVEKRWTGRQVQAAHMKLARQKHQWPRFALPRDRGSMTAADVMTAPPGPERDRAIDAWCEAVWSAFVASRQTVADLLRTHGVA